MIHPCRAVHARAMLATRRAAARVARLPARRRLSSSAVAVDNPYTGDVYVAAPEFDSAELLDRAHAAAEAQAAWARTPLSDRLAVCEGAIDWFKANADDVAADISGMMGKPRHHAKGEIGGLEERARHMMALAPALLADDVLPDKPGFTRRIAKEPIGTVFIMAPWNYPLLTSCNAVFPAVAAGNAVLIKQSPRTPLCANHYADAFAAAGAPPGLVQVANCDHASCGALLASKAVQHVVFTGSVGGGQAIYAQTAASTFVDVTLELGGKDPAYVAEDAELASAVATIVDGATFNNGQSCCAIERAYVHHSHYEDFLVAAQQEISAHVLGDPADPATSLGPLATPESIVHLQAQVDDAIAKGARLLAGGASCTDAAGKGRFFSPTLLADCTHDMEVSA
jgi:acyl-CoA reductase-like NAD-dependent aldehyde dehydrogenase